MTDQPEIHPTHNPEPADSKRLYRAGIACRRCGFFVSFDVPSYRVTTKGADPCVPVRVELRTVGEGTTRGL